MTTLTILLGGAGLLCWLFGAATLIAMPPSRLLQLMKPPPPRLIPPPEPPTSYCDFRDASRQVVVRQRRQRAKSVN
ncbi:MAG: hypothetical protein AB7S41_11335 [Parvibaculaceae bacterium]